MTSHDEQETNTTSLFLPLRTSRKADSFAKGSLLRLSGVAPPDLVGDYTVKGAVDGDDPDTVVLILVRNQSRSLRRFLVHGLLWLFTGLFAAGRQRVGRIDQL